jgi:hypothetical protein
MQAILNDANISEEGSFGFTTHLGLSFLSDQVYTRMTCAGVVIDVALFTKPRGFKIGDYSTFSGKVIVSRLRGEGT